MCHCGYDNNREYNHISLLYAPSIYTSSWDPAARGMDDDWPLRSISLAYSLLDYITTRTVYILHERISAASVPISTL